MLLQFALKVMADLIGCAVRLLYWSVRTYGWGRVAGFALAAALSFWLRSLWGRAGWDAATFWSIVAGTAVIWAGGLLAARWLMPVISRRLDSGRGGDEYRGAMPDRERNLPAFPRIEASSPALPPDSVSQGTEGRHSMASLWERAISPETLREAWQRVAGRGGSPGSDGMTVEAFSLGSDRYLADLAAEMAEGRYRPLPPRRVEVPKRHGGQRRLAILSVRDRVAQQAIHLVLARLWDGRFASCSYAYRPGRSAHQAVSAVEQALAHGRVWVVDADIESFFDSVPHLKLMAMLEEWLPEERMRWLVDISLRLTGPEPGKGLPQGAPTSPLLANLYLTGLDTALVQAGHTLVRYADDFVILCATRPQAEEALQTTRRLLSALELRLHPDKTRIVHRDEGFQFLGYRFTAAGKQPSEDALESLQHRLSLARDETGREQVLTGWRGYFGEDAPAAGPVLSSPESGDLSRWEEPDGMAEDSFWMEDTMTGETESLQPDFPAYRARFVGRDDLFARHWRREERTGYAPVRRPLTDDELVAHIRGETILGTYPLLPDGAVRALVLDIDGPDTTEEGQRKSFGLAHRLAGDLRDRSLNVLWEDSGGKGYHLWLCFREPVTAHSTRQWAGEWLEAIRPFPEGVMVEIFPKQDRLSGNALGSLMRLPLGLHPQTGRRSALLDSQGRPVADPWAYLASMPLNDPARLADPASPAGEAMARPEPPGDIRPVMEGCAILQGLVDKAARSRHLRHTERQALLYLLGGCGESGRAYLHQVMALCSNYDPRITQRWLHRLQEGRKPIRCATLKEWLRDYLPGVSCPCRTDRQLLSPLDYLKRPGRPVPETVPPSRSDDADWDRVARDLFGSEE